MKFYFGSLFIVGSCKAMLERYANCLETSQCSDSDWCCTPAGKWKIATGKTLDATVVKTESNTLEECKRLCRSQDLLKEGIICNSLDYNSSTSTCQLYQ